jgi:hypothetical protein
MNNWTGGKGLIFFIGICGALVPLILAIPVNSDKPPVAGTSERLDEHAEAELKNEVW